MHTPNPPLGLAYVASAIRNAGFTYSVIDATGEALDQVQSYPGRSDLLQQGLSFEQIVSRIPKGADIIGVGCMFSTLWPLTHLMAEEIHRSFPKALLVLGGEHGTAVPENVLHSSVFDVVVLGEAEQTVLSLISAYREGIPLSGVAGIAFINSEGKFVDTGLSPRIRETTEIPWPDWDSFPIEEYVSHSQINGINMGRSMPILATRGCPYQCTFCSNPRMWTTRYLPRDAKEVVDEIEHYVEKYDVRNVSFQDLTAVVKRSWVIEFCTLLIARKLNITWQMPSGTRAEIFDQEVADLLYRSGCRALAFAPESGSPQILAAVKKQIDLNRLRDAVRIAVDRGLSLSCFFVIGLPGETTATLRQTAKLVRQLAFIGTHDIGVAKFIPYPGSELFHQMQSEGKIALDDAFFVSPMDFYSRSAPSYADGISSRQLYWWMLYLFTSFYLLSFAAHPLRALSILLNAVVDGRQETRYARWIVDRFVVRRKWRKLNRRAEEHFRRPEQEHSG